MSVAELRQILKQGQDGKNLYDHLVSTIVKILLDKPPNAYDMFESISADVKANPFNPENEIYKSIPPTPEEVTLSFFISYFISLFLYFSFFIYFNILF